MCSDTHLKKPQDFWRNVLWIDKTKVKMFDRLILSEKYSDGGTINSACFAPTEPGHLELLHILESNVRPSDSKHKRKSRKEWFKKKRINML